MFEVPGAGITEVHVTDEYVKGNCGPVYVRSEDNLDNNNNGSEEDEMNATIRVKQ